MHPVCDNTAYSSMMQLHEGNDGGGSIRVPAACCGVVGLKPTWGRDYLGGGPKGVTSLTCTGPIAGSVADALLMYAVICNAGKLMYRGFSFEDNYIEEILVARAMQLWTKHCDCSDPFERAQT